MATRDASRQPGNRRERVQTDLGLAAVRMFGANERMNQVLIEHLAQGIARRINLFYPWDKLF
ncbi:MAG: hypothetical protein WAM69_15525 [Candidatus Sulfotelmatobacter sp.]